MISLLILFILILAPESSVSQTMVPSIRAKQIEDESFTILSYIRTHIYPF